MQPRFDTNRRGKCGGVDEYRPEQRIVTPPYSAILSEQKEQKHPYKSRNLQKNFKGRKHRESLQNEYHYPPADNNSARYNKMLDALAWHDQVPFIGVFSKYFSMFLI